jgi:hypothetical protein
MMEGREGMYSKGVTVVGEDKGLKKGEEGEGGEEGTEGDEREPAMGGTFLFSSHGTNNKLYSRLAQLITWLM